MVKLSTFREQISQISNLLLNLSDDVHSLDNVTEDDVLIVQPVSLLCANEELGACKIKSLISMRAIQPYHLCSDRNWPWKEFQALCASGGNFRLRTWLHKSICLPFHLL